MDSSNNKTRFSRYAFEYMHRMFDKYGVKRTLENRLIIRRGQYDDKKKLEIHWGRSKGKGKTDELITRCNLS